MIDDLIEYYQRELNFLRGGAGAFSDAYPKIASRLRLTREAIEDPHIGRLIESVAFMNARLRHKIDDEFPELSDALLLTLYPHLVQPVPSFMVARLDAAPDLDKPVIVPRGTVLLTESINGEPCRYRTSWDTTLLPLRIKTAAMGGPPLDAPALGVSGAKGMLRLTLATSKPDIDLAGLGIDQLRLYIKSDARRAQILIEQFGANLLGIGVGTSPSDPRAVLLPATALRLMGLEADELLLPQGDIANIAYATVQEHFAYPQKHLFVEINGLAARTLDIAGEQLDLFFYFDRLSPELERVVRADDFELFACPAINLFEMEAEPIQIDHSSIEYRIIPDTRREDGLEVHSVLSVTLQDGAGERLAAPPLHAIDRGSARIGRMFHATTRRSSFGPGGGDDVFLSVADLDGRLLGDDATVASARILVTNRDLPVRLPFGGGRPALNLAETSPGVGGAAAVTKPTPTRRPARQRAAVWKLLGQLSLNHLSLAGGARGGAALREVLALYDVVDTAESGSLRERLISVRATPGVARMRLRGYTAMCAGVDVTLEIDDERLSGSGAFLLCSVLERFLATACALNSFVRVSARLRRDDAPVENLDAARRRSPADMTLLETLRRRVGSLTFPQLARLGEQWARLRRPDMDAEVGADVPHSEEAVHFTASDRMMLAASDVADIGTMASGAPLPVTANLLGLAGATPAMPPFYSEIQLQRRRLRDRSLSSFNNIFDHRALSFFYRIFRKYNWVVSVERSPVPGDDPISRAVLALAGFATPASRARLGIDDAVLTPLAAHLGDQRRSAAAVETVLRALTGFDLHVIEAEPVWLALPLAEQTRLGGVAMRRFSQLGGTDADSGLGTLDAAVLGATVLDIQHHYAVAMGPLGHAELLAFCRDNGPVRMVGEACLLAAGMEHQPILRLSIDAADIPPLQLGTAATPALLARTAWLGAPGPAGMIVADCEIPIDRTQIAEGA